MASFGSAVRMRREMREWALYSPRPTHLPSRSRTSTTAPLGTLVVGFSTIFWNTHGWDDRRSILRRTTGKVAGSELITVWYRDRLPARPAAVPAARHGRGRAPVPTPN